MKEKERKQPDSTEQGGQQQSLTPPDAAPSGIAPGDDAENAFKQLRHAVKKKVREESAKLAASLVKSALEGNSSSTRIMVSLVEKKKKKNKSKDKGKRGHSLALDLASDPQVSPEDDEWSREEERETRERDV